MGWEEKSVCIFSFHQRCLQHFPVPVSNPVFIFFFQQPYYKQSFPILTSNRHIKMRCFWLLRINYYINSSKYAANFSIDKMALEISEFSQERFSFKITGTFVIISLISSIKRILYRMFSIFERPSNFAVSRIWNENNRKYWESFSNNFRFYSNCVKFLGKKMRKK